MRIRTVLLVCSGLFGSTLIVGSAAAGPPAPGGTPPAPQQSPAIEPDIWSPKQIAAARAHCKAVLKKVHAETRAVEPIKDGACGSAAVFEVISIGKKPAVALNPPPVLTCDMVLALGRWINRDLQPLARRHLGTSVKEIGVMSSYSCRNAYGRKTGRLSEHAFANALDIRGFSTSNHSDVSVLNDWGMTARKLRALAKARAVELAAEKAKEDKTAQQAAARSAEALKERSIGAFATSARVPEVAPADEKPATAETNNEVAKDTFSASALAGFSSMAKSLFADPTGWNGETHGFGAPSRLGGPKAATAALRPEVVPPLPEAKATAGRRAFLHGAHKSACKHFGTVLGPEANRAHENHFHVDMANRPRGAYCR